MPSYLDELNADPARQRQALDGLIAEQNAVIARLDRELAAQSRRLDRAVLRLHVFTENFGQGASETLLAQRDAEAVNTRVNETRRKLERQQATLRLFETQRGQTAGTAQRMLSAANDVGSEEPRHAT